MQETNLPSWLTQEYLQSKLRAYYKNDELRVLKLWSKAATSKGENYVGIMTRIHVDFEQEKGLVQQQTYLLKETCSDSTPQAEIFAEYNVYTREMDMYEFVLPQMQLLLQEIGLTDKLHADAICVDREHSVLILEDLATLQFTNASRTKQLDLEHTKLTLEMLAKFHAAGTMLKQRQPQLLANNFSQSFFSRGPKGYRPLFCGLFKALLRYVKTQPKLKSLYYAKLEHVLANLMEYAARSFDVDEHDLQTLNHGDCWTTNVMFQYDEKGNPKAVVPIDFQFSLWASPAVDLHYLFSTSLREEVRVREAELVQHHYYALKQNLLKFNYKGNLPSLHEYQLQFERRRFMAVVIGTLFQPLMIYEGIEDPEFTKLYYDTPEAIRFQDSIYESARAQEIVAILLPIFDAKGLLDAQ